MGSRVLEHLDVALRERGRHRAVVVVVAEDREDAVRRTKRRQRVGGRLDVVAIGPRDVIAAKHDDVGMLPHQGRHGVRHIVMGYPPAPVDVREEADSKSGERRRKIHDANGLASQRKRVTAVQKAVRADAGERPNTAAGESFEHRPATDSHPAGIVTRWSQGESFR